jgi:hypothetical protein
MSFGSEEQNSGAIALAMIHLAGSLISNPEGSALDPEGQFQISFPSGRPRDALAHDFVNRQFQDVLCPCGFQAGYEDIHA